jgi:hypothetical protein
MTMTASRRGRFGTGKNSSLRNTQEVGRAQRRPGSGEQKNLLLLSGIETRFFGYPNRNLVIIQTELPRLAQSV